MLDLGSNSFHVLVADARPDGTLVPVAREREMLHLGTVVQRLGHIPDDHRERATDTVAHLTELAARLGATQRLAVATSALRDAANGKAVIEGMEAAASTHIRVLDGDTEAQLAYAGVRTSVAMEAEPALVMDLGGGSLEFAVGTGTEVAWTASLDVGVSRLSAMLTEDPPATTEVRHLRELVRDALAPHRATIASLDPGTVVAVGGTIRALGRLVAAEHHDWLPSTLNQLSISTDSITGLRKRLTRMPPDERATVPGMKSKRVDRIHVAATIIDVVLDTLGLDGFVLSDWGLREGVLLDALGVAVAPGPAELREREITRVVETFIPQVRHLPHVATLALQLFDGTRSLHGLGPDSRELLWHAGRVHGVGEALALRRHHQHGAYIIEHAELRGFAPQQTAMLCSVVRFHTSRGVSTDYPPFASLPAERRREVEQLVALLQLADGLDRTRDQSVTAVGVRLEDDAVVVEPFGQRLQVARTEFERKAAIFERVYRRRVRLSAADDDAPTPPATG